MNATVAQELSELEHLIDQLRRGKWNRTEFRVRSVHYGVYTMRQPDRYFVRIRVPLGMVSARQLRALAGALRRWGEGYCHLTTRQGFEIHGLTLESIAPLLRALAEVELASHETGGSAVRSIMVCPHAGLGLAEPFDVSAYAILLMDCFVRHPEFQNLPRKVKIGFSCCDDDCARTAVQDLGFQARVDAQGTPGFRVLVGGGTGALPRLGQELLSFLPGGELPLVTEAFLRTFDRLGDRENRQRARVKFLVQRLGLDRFRQEVESEMHALQAKGRSYPALPTLERERAASESPSGARAPSPDGAAPTLWDGARPQRQAGFSMVRVAVPGGKLQANQVQAMAGLVERFELGIRLAADQSFLIRWAQLGDLAEIKRALAEAGLLPDLAIQRLVSCPGSTACSNAFTNAPGLAEALQARLRSIAGLSTAGPGLSIRVSGCGNGCGLHVKSDIGLQGVANRFGEDWMPAYRVWLGGREHRQRAGFGADLGMVPARNVPECVAELVAYYLRSRQDGESVADILDRLGAAPFLELARKFQLEPGADRRALMIDWGETVAYRPREASVGGVC